MNRPKKLRTAQQPSDLLKTLMNVGRRRGWSQPFGAGSTGGRRDRLYPGIIDNTSR